MTLDEAITLQQRDPKTGLRPNVTYYFRSDGSIDWKAMVERRFMFVIDSKRDAVVKAQGKPIDECDLSLVDDRWLRIKQGGFNQLANLRGYHSLDYHSVISTDGKASLVCTIEWIGNYESQMESFTCAGVASASTLSVDKGFRPYLETFAENRAFARAVKRALQITILSEDEIDGEALRGVKGENEDSDPSTSDQPRSAKGYDVLRTKCTNHKPVITFEALKARAVRHNAELTPEREDERIKSDPSSWTDWSSIQDVDVWLLSGKIDEADKAATKGKTKQ